MKKLFASFLLIGLVAFASTRASAQCCPEPAISGCIGMCGGEEFHSVATVIETTCYTYCLTNSLCGSRGVHLTIKAGNRVIVAGLSQNGDSGTFCVNAGESLSIDLTPGPVNRNINCFAQGEATVSLCPVQ
jgi:hypothetical protein